MFIQNFIAYSTDIKIKLFQLYCCNLYCAQLRYNSNKAAVAETHTAYNKGLRRLLLYKLDNFQHTAREMFVAKNMDSVDVLIRKSLHGFIHIL